MPSENHPCPNPAALPVHRFGSKNAGSCPLCTSMYKESGIDCNRVIEYYAAIWAYYQNRLLPSEAEVQTCVDELSAWLGPQECRKHECVENRSEIERHHRDFAQISELLDGYFLLDDQERFAHTTLTAIRNIVG